LKGVTVEWLTRVLLADKSFFSCSYLEDQIRPVSQPVGKVKQGLGLDTHLSERCGWSIFVVGLLTLDCFGHQSDWCALAGCVSCA